LSDPLSGEPLPRLKGENCVLHDDVSVGAGTRLGNFVFIRDQTSIGRNCIVGSFVDIEGDVRIGDYVSLQSGCYVTRGVVIEDEVFCGPRVITMNDKTMSYRRDSLQFVRQAPRILRAARVGGGSVLLPGVTIGENALVGAGSVVTRDVADGTIVVGNPARQVGLVAANELL
jgi:acetyltransferase-like isoleucine patch superfamily enzyme